MTRSGCLLFVFLGLCAVLAGVAGSFYLPEAARLWLAQRLPGHPVIVLAPTPPPVILRPLATPMPTPTPTPTPEPTLPSQPVIPPKTREVARLYNGIQVRSGLDAEPGRLASVERESPASYALDLRMQIKIPAAGKTAADLAHTAPGLATLLPGLPALLEKAEVSKFYYGIYELKTDLLRQNLTRLDALMGADTFYDTETILEMQDPATHRKALLIQTAMQVDTDGSDADRLNEPDPADPDFQPLTSYKWLKRTPVVSALLKPRQDRLVRLQSDAAVAPPARRHDFAAAAEALRSDIYQLQHYSSLIARTDPYIVLPGFMARANGHPYQPHLGDYAVVVSGDRLYPAIFGDIGPSYKLGEASLRLAQAVDSRATASRSPIDDLKITYLVFPGSADTPPGPPDLDKIRQRCQALLNEIGGSKGTLHEWANLIPAPTPAPTPTPSPTPGPSPAASPSPGSTPASSPSTTAPVPGASPATSPKPSLAPGPGPSAPLSPSPVH